MELYDIGVNNPGGEQDHYTNSSPFANEEEDDDDDDDGLGLDFIAQA